jgi:uncharacterized membrane protein YbhN (UPF0104 family)
VSKWQRIARWIAFAILVVVSIHGVREFLAGDATALAAMWQRTLAILPIVFLFACLDIAVEAMAWMLVFRRLGMRALDWIGSLIALSGKAGLLMPAQLGRLIRPELMVRTGRASFGDGAKGEGAVFLLDATSVLALLVGLVCWRVVHPALAPVAFAAVITTCLFAARFIARFVAGTALEVPVSFWWSLPTFMIVVLQSLGWAAHGFGFYFLASALDGGVGLWEALAMAPGAAVLGLASGLPGGLGTTEVLLGTSLGLGGVPQAQLGVGVGVFRVLTFWIWLPIGWIAFGIVVLVARRRRAAAAAAEPVASEIAAVDIGAAEPEAMPRASEGGVQ